MSWGTVEMEPEVSDWLRKLPKEKRRAVGRHINRLAEHGPLLGEPYTRQLRGKLRELRFSLDGDAVRVTYYIAPGGRIVLLTVFGKTRRREEREVLRALRVFKRRGQGRHSARMHNRR